MRTVSGALQSFLESRQKCWKADLFTITTLKGVNYYWTDFDQPITYSNAYLALGPALQRTRLGVKNTVEVPELTIKVSSLDTDLVGGLMFKEQIHNGYLDGATVSIDRLFMRFIGDTGLGVIGNFPGGLFQGRMSSARITAVGAELTVKGANVLMNQYVPRNQYQIPCLHTFCDAGCTLLAATFTTAQTVGSGSTTTLIKWGSVPGNPALYTLGKITVTSGAANGQVRTIKSASAAGIQLQYPLYNTPAPGDTFSAMQGCDRTYNSGSGQDCTAHSNTQHFRGFPFIPPAETAF
jgi:hypothetical protein